LASNGIIIHYNFASKKRGMQLKTFRTTLFLLIPFLAMTEGGAMYQWLVNVPLWIRDMSMMKIFYDVGFCFFLFAPAVLILWLIVVISGRKYTVKAKCFCKSITFFI
jgi:hypothetical protein